MRKWTLLVSELIFVAILLLGVASIYVPAALILTGVLGVWACERALAVQAASGPVRAGKKAKRS